jgi:hypothetical protein
VLQGHIKESRNFDILSHIAVLKMRDSVVPGPVKTIARNMQSGIFIPGLFSKDGYASWHKCYQRNEMITNEENVFGV